MSPKGLQLCVLPDSALDVAMDQPLVRRASCAALRIPQLQVVAFNGRDSVSTELDHTSAQRFLDDVMSLPDHWVYSAHTGGMKWVLLFTPQT